MSKCTHHSEYLVVHYFAEHWNKTDDMSNATSACQTFFINFINNTRTAIYNKDGIAKKDMQIQRHQMKLD